MSTHIHFSGKGRIDELERAADDRLIVPEVEDLAWDRPRDLVVQVRLRNDALAGHAAGSVRRFGLLPFPLIDESLAEIAHVLDELSLDGVCIVPLAGGRSLDEPDFTVLLAEIDRRHARLLIHPADTAGAPLVNPHYLDSVLALARLLFFDRIKSISHVKILLAHTCGVTDFLAENIGMLAYLQAERRRMGRFLFDFLIRKRLRGVEQVRSAECCE